MKSIEIVTHCYSGAIPIYADHLRFQIESLFDSTQSADLEFEIELTVFWAGPEHDKNLAWLDGLECAEFALREIVLPKEQLFRRAIGRHRRTQETTCDLLWLADADMVFGDGCLDFVCENVRDDGRLYYPRRTLINIDHAAGETTLKAGENERWPKIDPSLFKWQRNKVAIGGIQIMGRETAKKVGYLGGTKWCKPVDPDKPFACFRDDSAWRRSHFPQNKTVQKQVSLDVPNIYRIRHERSSLRPEGFAGHQLASQDTNSDGD